MVNFPTQIPDCDSHIPALLDIFLCSNTSICSTVNFPPLGNSDHVAISVSIDLPSNSLWDATFHHRTYDYSRAEWDSLHDPFRDVPWGDIFKICASAVASKFCDFRLKLMHVSLTISMRSGLTHLHRFQLLALLPQFTEITFFVYTTKINLLNLKESSDRLAIVAKGFLKLIKQKTPSFPRNLTISFFGELPIVFSTKVNLLYPFFCL